jgi:hypothetical protein
MLGIVCKLYNRLGGGSHQQIVHPLLIAAKYTAQCVRNGYYDVEIVARQQFSCSLFEPSADLVSVAGRAVPVTAGMIDIDLFAAMTTPINMPAFGLCSALLDVGYRLFVRGEH